MKSPAKTFVAASSIAIAFNILRAIGLFGRFGGIVLFFTSIALVAFARQAGLTKADLGIERDKITAGLRTGAIAFGIVLTVVVIGALLPATAGFLDDDRTRIGFATLTYEVIVSTLILTAFPAVRGVAGWVLVTAGNVIATAVAGSLFCWLRVLSQSIVAPIIGHLATNGITLTVAWVSITFP